MLVLALCLVIIIIIIITRPHLNATYVHAAYCYRRSSVVCPFVGLSVCRSVFRSLTIASPAKTAEPIEMPFWLLNRVGPRNHVLDGGLDPPCEGAILKVKGAAHCKV